MISQRFYRSVSLFVRLSVSSSLCSGSSSSSNRNSSGSIISSCGWLNRICDLLAWNAIYNHGENSWDILRFGSFLTSIPSSTPLRCVLFSVGGGETQDIFPEHLFQECSILSKCKKPRFFIGRKCTLRHCHWLVKNSWLPSFHTNSR